MKRTIKVVALILSILSLMPLQASNTFRPFTLYTTTAFLANYTRPSVCKKIEHFKSKNYVVRARDFIREISFRRLNASLWQAVENNDYSAVNACIAQGANINIKNSAGKSLLALACEKCAFDVVDLLLCNGAVPDSTCSEHCPLLIACKKEKLTIIYRLLDQMQLETMNYSKRNVFNWVCDHGSDGVIKVFVDMHVFRLFAVACKKGSTKVIDRYVDACSECPVFSYFSKWSELIGLACKSGSLDSVRRVLDKVKGVPSISDLSKFCDLTNLEFVELFITHGSSVDEDNFLKLLDLACKKNNKKVAKLLLKKIEKDFSLGGEEQLFSDDDHPIFIAYKNKNNEMLKFLIACGVDVNVKNRYKQTLLHHACRDANFEMAKILIEKGASLSVQDTFGSTPLHYASMRNADKIISLLLEHGANHKIKDSAGKIALVCACDFNHFKSALKFFNIYRNDDEFKKHSAYPILYALDIFRTGGITKKDARNILFGENPDKKEGVAMVIKARHKYHWCYPKKISFFKALLFIVQQKLVPDEIASMIAYHMFLDKK